MNHIYEIKGMTCKGCEAGVSKILNEIDGVIKANVILEKEEAIIKMEHHISIDTLRQALPEKYQISEKETRNVFQSDAAKGITTDEKTKLQQLKPLFLIFFYLISASVLLHLKNWNTAEAMLDFMGLFYIVFSFFKLLDLKGFPDSFAMYDPIAKRIKVYGWVYPFIEVALGLMFLFRFEVFYALVGTLAILGVTTIGVTQTLLNRKTIQCACLGTALKLPMTQATFIENSVMIVMAIFMLVKMT
ncbi:heavy-metal-associated domain-containing protein [Spongiivirga citrea]|uniref:Heavy metal transporter n=1 Tax=Spongiivirga citrea TaxID=1481457 RepID=A0A6M0CEV4_9FLAO|nr:heavy metal-associated domain-containing protein [Spongiivirga citrea]NER16291.1 heavy metal transporter [Spongiivirga citrea]